MKFVAFSSQCWGCCCVIGFCTQLAVSQRTSSPFEHLVGQDFRSIDIYPAAVTYFCLVYPVHRLRSKIIIVAL